ncbi:MAG: hypothetical protein ACK6EB_24360, partial [Planctomyces sp.]
MARRIRGIRGSEVQLQVQPVAGGEPVVLRLTRGMQSESAALAHWGVESQTAGPIVNPDLLSCL